VLGRGGGGGGVRILYSMRYTAGDKNGMNLGNALKRREEKINQQKRNLSLFFFKKQQYLRSSFFLRSNHFSAKATKILLFLKQKERQVALGCCLFVRTIARLV
jgi:hypothetical protein